MKNNLRSLASIAAVSSLVFAATAGNQPIAPIRQQNSIRPFFMPNKSKSKAQWKRDLNIR